MFGANSLQVSFHRSSSHSWRRLYLPPANLVYIFCKHNGQMIASGNQKSSLYCVCWTLIRPFPHTNTQMLASGHLHCLLIHAGCCIQGTGNQNTVWPNALSRGDTTSGPRPSHSCAILCKWPCLDSDCMCAAHALHRHWEGGGSGTLFRVNESKTLRYSRNPKSAFPPIYRCTVIIQRDWTRNAVLDCLFCSFR